MGTRLAAGVQSNAAQHTDIRKDPFQPTRATERAYKKNNYIGQLSGLSVPEPPAGIKRYLKESMDIREKIDYTLDQMTDAELARVYELIQFVHIFPRNAAHTG